MYALRRREPVGESVDIFVHEVRRMLAREVDGGAIDRDGEIPARVRAACAAQGLFGLTIPEAHGGAALALRDACRVVAEIARVDRSVAIMVGLHAGLGTRGLVTLGAPQLRARWLPRLASGDCIASFAATEAGAGSDLTAIRTTLTDEGGGSTFRLDGEKSYVTNGRFAGMFTVLARSPGLGGARAHSLVCVPADTPGIELGKEESKLGIRGSSTVTVRFDHVRLAREQILGTLGRGMEHAHDLLTWGRTLMSAGCIGTGRAALDAAITHVTTRKQFGRAVGVLGATRAHVAWMAARLHAMEALVDRVAALEAFGDSMDRPSAIAKVFCSESAFTICDRSLQLHGAVGFLEPMGVARMLRDCRITRIFEGANDVLLVRIGAARIAQRGEVRVVCGDPRIDALAGRIAAVVDTTRARFGIGAVRKQVVLQRIACAEVALAAASACAPDAAVPLANAAIDALVDDGERSLDALSHADRDEERDLAISEALYASGMETQPSRDPS